jgi:sortase A
MSLSKINNTLLALILLLNFYVIAAPFFPAIIFSWESRGNKEHQLSQLLKSSAQSSPSNHSSTDYSAANLTGDRVIIPSMILNQSILEGPIYKQFQILDRGIWRWPNSSTPDKGGNTVLVGHRFTYTIPKGVFYYLNKLKIGDQIGIFWNNHEYLYKVSTINVVPPTDTSIEQNSIKPEVTLFTCTPLWLPKNRLVVVASLDG